LEGHKVNANSAQSRSIKSPICNASQLLLSHLRNLLWFASSKKIEI
jgi:hypothetical protein